MGSSKPIVGVSDIPTTASWMIPYFQGGKDEAKNYKSQSHKKIKPKCPYCGAIRDSPMKINTIYHNMGFSCTCNDKISLPNKIIFYVMRQLYEKGLIEKFKREYRFANHNLPFDMYFVSNYGIEYLIEMDSDIHSYICELHNVSKPHFRIAQNDKKKTELAKRNNIELIRIDCYRSDFNLIKNNILNSKLSKIIELSLVDWNQVFEKACNNLVKEVCDFKARYPNFSTTKISEKFGLCVDTIMRYLKMGNEIGWCEYNPKDEWYKAHTNLIRRNRDILTEVTEHNGNRYYFRTLKELEDKSLVLFGIKFSRKKISKMLKEQDNEIYYQKCSIKRISKEEYLDGICKSG